MAPFTIKHVDQLERGESFIWLDDYTRDFMCVEDDPNRLQVLKFDYVDSSTYYPKEGQVFYTYLDGSHDSLYYDAKCLVIAFTTKTHVMASGLRCDNCKRSYGNHFTNGDATVHGIRCNSADSGQWFVVNDESFADYYAELLSAYRNCSKDFFASIGL